MAKWTLEGTPFEINPQSHGEDKKKKFHIIDIIEGGSVIQEGEEEVPTMPCDITVISQAAKTQLDTWYDTSGELTLVDDHNTSRTVLIEALNLTREFSASHQWFYKGTISFRITG